MNTIHIKSAIQSYDIVIGNKIRHLVGKYLPRSYSAILIISDSNVANLYMEDIAHAFTDQEVYIEVISPGEQAKNINTYYYLQTKAIEYQLDRKSLIIALGGGVVGDLSGFVAATFMRGIDYVQIPTTILAHDSSVGGKVAINHENGKNLIGSFYPPVLVFYDTDMLKTLPQREVRSGYAELIKEAMLADLDLLNRLLNVSLPAVNMEETTYFLEKGMRIKADIVELDEKESGTRMYLNLGHTLGHALETKLGYGVITHGEAVAIGLLFAVYVSNNELKAEIPIHKLKTWLNQNQYPLDIPSEIIDDLVNIMKRDKKTIHKQVQMILLQGISEPVVHMIDDLKLRKYLTAFVMEEMKGGI